MKIIQDIIRKGGDFTTGFFFSCENERQHKHKEICYVWPIKGLVPDSVHLGIDLEQNG